MIPLRKQWKLTDNEWELDEEVTQRLHNLMENVGLDTEDSEHKALSDAIVILDEDEWE